MFQLSFLNTGLLIFAAATILPLLIWFLAKRKPQRLIFSSLRFIKLSKDQEKKRTRFKNILLLLIRMLIILLVVLSVARPVMRSPRLKPGSKHPPTALAIILDTSYSMDYLSGSKSILEQGKQLIRRINLLTNQDDRLIPITSDQNWNLLHSQIYARLVPADLLESIRITHQPQEMKDLLLLAERKLAETQLPNREIYLLTDRQAMDYPQDTDTPVFILPLVQKEEYSNLACHSARAIPQLVDRQRSQILEFKLSNYGMEDKSEVLVKAVVNGIKLAENFVSLPARQTISETIQIELQNDGWQSGYIEVLDDRLSSDNRSYFSFPFYLNPRIAVISETGSTAPALGSLLAVYAGSGGRITTIHPSTLNYSALAEYNLVVLNNISSMNPKLREVLSEIKAAGKGVLYTTGRALNGDYKAWLEQTFSVQIGDYLSAESSLDFVNRHHFVSSIVAEQRVSRQSVRDFYSATATGSANPILSAGSNALVLSAGKSIVWLLDFNSQSNRFLLDPAFPVLAVRSLQYLGAGNPEQSKKELGDLIKTGSLTLPNGQRLELSAGSFRLSEPGIYIKHQPAEEHLAVDPDYSEGDFKPQNFKGLKSYKLLGSDWQKQIFQSRLGYELWKYLLFAALLLLILEIILVKLEELRATKTQ